MSLKTEYYDMAASDPPAACYLVHADRQTAEKLYCIEFTVIGRAEFPLDMLRFDMCHPVDTDSALAIGFNYDTSYSSELRRVRLRTWSRNKFWKPTFDRWRSFGWMVTSTVIDDRRYP